MTSAGGLAIAGHGTLRHWNCDTACRLLRSEFFAEEYVGDGDEECQYCEGAYDDACEGYVFEELSSGLAVEPSGHGRHEEAEYGQWLQDYEKQHIDQSVGQAAYLAHPLHDSNAHSTKVSSNNINIHFCVLLYLIEIFVFSLSGAVSGVP